MLKNLSVFSEETYIDLYLKKNERIFSFTHQEGDLWFKNIAIQSPIFGTPFYDLSSPYGYSGYFTNTSDKTFLKKALENQTLKAIKENIIAEFIRFHPSFAQRDFFEKNLDFFKYDRSIVSVRLKKEARWKNYSSNTRNQIKQSQLLYTFRLSQDYKKMFEVYTLAMKQKQADNFYFFSQEYFKKIINLPNCFMLEAILDRQICAMAIFLYDNQYAYYHLSATTCYDKKNSVGSMRGLLEEAFCLLENKNLSFCILGGGVTSSENDSLFLFKRKFSDILLPFYIGGKIYNHQIYQELSKNKNNNFFLKYRYPSGGGGI